MTIVEFGTGTAGAESDKGSALSTRKLLEKLDQNFPTLVCANRLRSTIKKYNKKQFSPKRKFTETKTSISIPIGIVDILLKQLDMPSARYVCFANAEELNLK